MLSGDREPERRDSTSESESGSETSSSGTSESSNVEQVAAINEITISELAKVESAAAMSSSRSATTKTTTTTTTQAVSGQKTNLLSTVQNTGLSGYQTSGMSTVQTSGLSGIQSVGSDIITSRTVGQATTTYGHSLYPNSYAAADQSGMFQREETRKVSSTIISEQFMNELPQENVKYVEVPVYQEVITHVTKKEIVEVEKRVPKYEYEYVEKIVEVPQIQIVDKHVEVQQIQEVIRHVPKLQIIDRPKEVIRHVPKVEVKVVEKSVEVPGPVVEVPKPYTVENPIPVTAFVDSDIPVVVAQSVHPIVTESDDVVEVDVTDYEPHVVPVDVHVVKPVSTAIHAGAHTEKHRLVSVPHAQYNSLLKSLNPHLAINGKIDQEILPFVRDESGQVVFLNNEAQFSPLPENVVVENMPKLRHRHREGRVVGHAASARTLNAQYDYAMPAVPVCQPRITRTQGPVTSMMPPPQPTQMQMIESRKSSYTGMMPQQSYTTTSPQQSYTMMPPQTTTTTTSAQQSYTMMPPQTTTTTTNMETVHRMPEPVIYGEKSQYTTMAPTTVTSSVIEAGRVTSQLPYTTISNEARPITVSRGDYVQSAYMSQQSSELPPVYPAGESGAVSNYYSSQVDQYGMPSYSQAAIINKDEAFASQQYQQASQLSARQQYLTSNAKTTTSVSSSDIMAVATDVKGTGCCGCGGTKKEVYVVRQDSIKPSNHTRHSKSTHHSKSQRSEVVSARSLMNEDAYVNAGSRTQKSETYQYEELSMPVTTATKHDKSKKICCC